MAATGRRLAVDTTGCRSVRPALRAVMDSDVPAVNIGPGTYQQLVAECGGETQAVRWLRALARRGKRPLFVTWPHADGARTIAIAPPDWTDERLQGWIAGVHAELEATWGPITSMSKDLE